MLFNSISFIFFFVIVLFLYYLPLLKWTQKKVMLLLASYLFYALWNPPLILLLWISTAVDWMVGNRLYQTTDERERKGLLLISLCVNLGFLAFFKYGGFFLDNFLFLSSSLGVTFDLAQPDIILPMGISFYTFQTMSYTIDMYYKRIQPARSLLDFSLYVTFFPQLVAGPIVRSNDLIPQFYEPKTINWEKFYWGAFLLTLGLFQKVVLADVLLSDTADAIFGHLGPTHPLDSWMGTLAFSGQIFFDFAGYSTCAIGIALMLGFRLPDNFQYPYAAIGFSDFWRRWHITLSTWLRDYLYIPLGGNRGSTARTYRNLMITMLLGGLWHGAAWNFVFWGFLHGFYLSMERMLRQRIRIQWNAWNSLLAAIATYFCINITWVFFRATSFEKALEMLSTMFLWDRSGAIQLQELSIIIVSLVTISIFSIHYLMRDTTVRAVASKTSPWLLGLGWALMIILIVIAQGTGEQFIYFQF